MGANLLCINRSIEKSENLKREIEDTYQVSCDYYIADLSILSQIYGVAQYLLNLGKKIDVLIHNAGVYYTKRQVTVDGLEKVFVVNYLSSFIINYILLEKFKSQGSGRVLSVNSEGHRFAVWGLDFDDLNWKKRKYTGLKSYGSAKLAQLLSMIVFDELLSGLGVAINAMHPGAVRTDTGKENDRAYQWVKKNIYDRLLPTPEISAEALYYLGVSKEIECISGKFFNLTTPEEPAPPALDREMAYKLWDLSIKYSRLEEFLKGA